MSELIRTFKQLDTGVCITWSEPILACCRLENVVTEFFFVFF